MSQKSIPLKLFAIDLYTLTMYTHAENELSRLRLFKMRAMAIDAHA